MTKHEEYMERALMAEWLPFDKMFGAIARPQTPEPLAHNVAEDELPWGDEE